MPDFSERWRSRGRGDEEVRSAHASEAPERGLELGRFSGGIRLEVRLVTPIDPKTMAAGMRAMVKGKLAQMRDISGRTPASSSAHRRPPTQRSGGIVAMGYHPVLKASFVTHWTTAAK